MSPDEMDTLLARLDTRTEYITKKVDSFCTFKDAAAIDIANLKNHCDNTKDIPAMVDSLEKSRAAAAAVIALIVIAIGWIISLLKVFD